MWAVNKSHELWELDRKQHDSLEAVRLKAPSDPLDAASLICAVSGWFYRSVFFRAECAGPADGGNYSTDCGLGYAKKPTTSDLPYFTQDANCIIISDAFTYDDAVRKVRDTLSTLTAGR